MQPTCNHYATNFGNGPKFNEILRFFGFSFVFSYLRAPAGAFLGHLKSEEKLDGVGGLEPPDVRIKI